MKLENANNHDFKLQKNIPKTLSNLYYTLDKKNKNKIPDNQKKN